MGSKEVSNSLLLPTPSSYRLFMEELVEYIERTPKARHASRWKHYLRSLPPPLSEVRSPKTWQPAYTMKAINSALSHVQIVAYNENIVSSMLMFFCK